MSERSHSMGVDADLSHRRHAPCGNQRAEDQERDRAEALDQLGGDSAEDAERQAEMKPRGAGLERVSTLQVA